MTSDNKPKPPTDLSATAKLFGRPPFPRAWGMSGEAQDALDNPEKLTLDIHDRAPHASARELMVQRWPGGIGAFVEAALKRARADGSLNIGSTSLEMAAMKVIRYWANTSRPYGIEPISILEIETLDHENRSKGKLHALLPSDITQVDEALLHVFHAAGQKGAAWA